MDFKSSNFRLKEEMNIISAQYSKEIDTLRRQLTEARDSIDAYERTRMMTQESLKKAFMKGVCAMNMEAMTILNPNEQTNIEKKFESLADGIFSESTPIRQLAFNHSNATEYKTYDSNIKEEEIFKRFGMQMSDVNESERSVNNSSIHHTPNERHRTAEDVYSVEKDIKPERNAYTELETASMSKYNVPSSAVKIHRPGDDIVISNTKIESKDNAWKPAPVMSTEPMIINNVKSGNMGYKANNLSFNHGSTIPKHTLGMPNMNTSIGSGMSGMSASSNLLSSIQNISRPKNNNLDLIENFTPQPHPHPGGNEPNYQSISYMNERPQVVKENVSSNIIDSIPSSSLPSMMSKPTSAVGGKTIRVNPG